MSTNNREHSVPKAPDEVARFVPTGMEKAVKTRRRSLKERIVTIIATTPGDLNALRKHPGYKEHDPRKSK